MCVKETATAAKETLLVTWPIAWHTATGISSFSRLESIGYRNTTNVINSCLFGIKIEEIKKKKMKNHEFIIVYP